MLGILAGFAAALGFGAADFLAGRSSRGIGVVWTVFTVQLAGLLALIPVMTLINVPLATAWDAWAVLVAVSAVNLAGILLLYRAFTIGSLSLVSPVASSFAAVAGLLAIIAGERPPALALNGAILLLIGVTLTAMVRGTGGVSRSGLLIVW